MSRIVLNGGYAVMQRKERKSGFRSGHYREAFWVHTPCSSFDLCRSAYGAILENFLLPMKVTGEVLNEFDTEPIAGSFDLEP